MAPKIAAQRDDHQHKRYAVLCGALLVRMPTMMHHMHTQSIQFWNFVFATAWIERERLSTILYVFFCHFGIVYIDLVLLPKTILQIFPFQYYKNYSILSQCQLKTIQSLQHVWEHYILLSVIWWHFHSVLKGKVKVDSTVEIHTSLLGAYLEHN